MCAHALFFFFWFCFPLIPLVYMKLRFFPLYFLFLSLNMAVKRNNSSVMGKNLVFLACGGEDVSVCVDYIAIWSQLFLFLCGSD